MKTYTTDDVTVKFTQYLTIVTSGYSDRFISTTSKYTIEVYTDKGQGVSCSFDDRIKAIGFMTNLLELSFDDAYSLLPDQPEMYVSGKTNRHAWMGKKISHDELGSIQAYLAINHKFGLTQEYMQKNQDYLAQHPLTGDLLAIVQWQISECDRKNIETWGHKNGQEG